LAKSNEIDEKYFQFFGGEPLLQKDLILDFLKENREELEKHPEIKVSMITNGTLLTDAFLQDYFSYPNSQIMISLDSHQVDVEHRHTSKEGVDKTLGFCKKIVNMGGDLTVRCTISLETLPYLEDYIQILIDMGVEGMVVHPLTMSATEGFIEWSEEDWQELERILKSAIYKNDNFMIHFSEGTGTKSCDTNCMVGSSMIAMDGSGDYSGCYFFTNQKAALPQTILGNIFTEEIHEDRYRDFEASYAQHFQRDERCHTCDLQNYCYQCPAGNLSTGDKTMFRSDSMCQQIVNLFLDLRRDENAKRLKRKIKQITDAHAEEGSIVYSRAIFQLTHRLNTGEYIPLEKLKRMELPDYQKLMAFIVIHPNYDFSQKIETINRDVDNFEGILPSRYFITLLGRDTGTDDDNANIGILHFLMSPRRGSEQFHVHNLSRGLL